MPEEKSFSIFGGLFRFREIPPKTASNYLNIEGMAYYSQKIFDSRPTADGLSEVRDLIARRADQIAAQLSQDKRGGWYRVKVSKREQEAKSVKCRIPCRLEGFEVGKPSECTFWAPLSRLHAEGKNFYCPGWLVHKGLEKTTDRSPTAAWRHVTRVPVEPPCWPEGLMQEWIQCQHDQLPTQNALDAARQEREQKASQDLVQAKEAVERARLEKEKKEQEREYAEARKREQTSKIRAVMECKKNVNIRWKEWTRKGGKCTVASYETEGVDLYFSGDRTYIVFPDGDELIKKASNVEIIGIGTVEEVTETPPFDMNLGEVTKSAPFGLKKDGTPRKAKAGPGRPRSYSPEEAAQRRRKCRERWKAENKEKMKEYRRSWRERQKAT